MKLVIILGFFLSLGFFHEVYAQSNPTKIVRFEVDGKEVNKSYKVFFRSNDKWIESQKTSTGFILPTEMRNNEYLTMLITLRKYKLEFPNIHISKFDENWVVGIDNKPFSEENVDSKEMKIVKRVYYINFVGSGLETRLVIKEKNSN